MRTAVETGTNRAVGSLQTFRGLDLTVRRRLDGLLHGEYGGVGSVPAVTLRSSRAISPVTTYDASTGTSPRERGSRTCG